MSELQVWMNGQAVGVWTTLRTGTPVWRYHEAWVASPEGRALSLSLPFTQDLEHRGDKVTNYFDNLLPDSAAIRRRLRRRWLARSDDAFDLLAAIGRDCVGAVQLLPPGATPQGWNQIEAEPLDVPGVAAILASSTSDAPLGQGEEEDLRVSIAGAQEKTALLRIGNRWHRPLGATPTTHILKLPLGLVGNMRADMTDSVENEWLCGRIMRALGFDIAHAEIGTFEATRALVVTRFDRRWQGISSGADTKPRFRPPRDAWIARLPQEDFCQALGIAPERKYQSDGGPSMRDCLQVLAASERPEQDQSTFALAQLAFWLLAATDGHGKNFSIRHRRDGRFGLTPLYDILSAWPIIGDGPHLIAYRRAKLAMSLRGEKNAHARLGDIQPRHWQRLAAACGPGVWELMRRMVLEVEPALSAVESELPARFPARTWERIAAGMRRHATQFARTADAGASG
jgi:serine/threonine-protein kinase HipA